MLTFRYTHCVAWLCKYHDVLVDSYSNASGSIDAILWVLFVPVLWGVVAWFIWRVIRNRKTRPTQKSENNAPTDVKVSGGLTTSTAPVRDGWELPRYSSGYLKNPGWYTDPSGLFYQRYFDGNKWTDGVLKRTRDVPTTVLTKGQGSQSSNTALQNDLEQHSQRPETLTSRGNQLVSKSLASELTTLAELHQKGLLDDDEFKNAKQQLLLNRNQ